MANQEAILIQGLQAGDSQAFRELVRKYHDQLCNEASFCLDQKSAAQDMVQEVFLTIWLKRETLNLQAVSNLKLYLVRAVRNTCLNHNLNQSRKAEHETNIAAASTAYEEYEHFQESDTLHFFKRILLKLPETNQRIIRKRFLEDKGREEIALEMGMKPKSITKNVKMSLDTLREQLLGIQ